MAKYKIAHFREQGVDLIVVPLASKFGRLTKQQQSDFIAFIQSGATHAGLAGTVVPVWQDGRRHCFIAPPKWHPFFESFGWADICRNINKELTCD
jgi:hypothetical protein